MKIETKLNTGLIVQRVTKNSVTKIIVKQKSNYEDKIKKTIRRRK